MKYFAVIVFALAGLLLVWHVQPDTHTPVALQRELLAARTEAAKAAIIAHLDGYFSSIRVPDSIVAAVRADIDTTHLPASPRLASLDAPENNQNTYQLESELGGLLAAAMVARARNDATAADEQFAAARPLAALIDGTTGVAYWAAHVARMSQFTPEQAYGWLEARSAMEHCKSAANANLWREAEFFGGLGLQRLAQADDPRLRLDIRMRLQFVLYAGYALADLSIAWAEPAVREAQAINYVLREKAIAYYQADALSETGAMATAPAKFHEIFENISRLPAHPDLEWYRKKALISAADAHWQLGNFYAALALCDQISRLSLDDNDAMLLHITRGLNYRALARYAEAEHEYNLAYGLAAATEDFANKIRIQTNRGWLFYELTEYDKALKSYSQALAELEASSPGSLPEKINLLLNIAQVKARQMDTKALDELIHETAALLERVGNMPLRRVDLYRTMGKFQASVGRYQAAIPEFERAVRLCEANGLVRIGMETRFELAQTLLAAASFEACRKVLNDLQRQARRNGQRDILIDALGLAARLEFHTGDREGARAQAAAAMEEIRATSAGFAAGGRSRAYRQRIYDYHKDAAFYEIQAKQVGAALDRLELAAAPAAPGSNPMKALRLDAIIGSLEADELALRFLITHDSLYVFEIGSRGLRLHRRAVDAAALQAQVAALLDSMKAGETLFRRYDAARAEAHYRACTNLGHSLYTALLGWTEIDTRFGQEIKRLYIFPDEFLHRLPFAILVPALVDTATYLVQRVAIAYPQDLHSLENRAPARGAPPVDTGALLFADRRFAGMPAFVDAVRALLPGVHLPAVAAGENSRAAALQRLNQPHAVCIFAGHSLANDLEPEFSYIECALDGPAGEQHLVRMSQADLEQLRHFRAGLVMLTACETAAGKLYRGSGISGLQNSLLSRGAGTVVASLWKIDAAQALPQAEEFLREYLSSGDAMSALQHVQTQAIARLAGHRYFKWPHPYFWGSYMLHTNFK